MQVALKGGRQEPEGRRRPAANATWLVLSANAMCAAICLKKTLARVGFELPAPTRRGAWRLWSNTPASTRSNEPPRARTRRVRVKTRVGAGGLFLVSAACPTCNRTTDAATGTYLSPCTHLAPCPSRGQPLQGQASSSARPPSGHAAPCRAAAAEMWTARPDAQVLRMDRVPGWAVCPSTGWGRTQGLGILYIIVRARARAGLRLRHEARAHCSTTSPLALTDRSMPSEGSHTVTIRCPATRSASACSGRFAPGRLHDSGVAGGASSATSGGGGAYTVGSCRCVSFSRSSAFRSLRAFFSFFSVFSFFSLFSFLALRFSCLRSFLRSRFRRSRPELLLLLLLLVSSSSRLLRFWCFCLWRSASGRVSLLTALVVSPQQSRFLWSTTIAIDARRLATENLARRVG